MRRQQIIAIVVVLLLAGGAGAGYQFYFKPTLEKFAEDRQYLQQLNAKLKKLKDTFPSGKPDAAVKAVAAQIQPWSDAVEQRARQFSIRDFRKIDDVPDTSVLRAYYAEASTKLSSDVIQEAFVKQVYLNQANIDTFFGMPRPDTMQSKSVQKLEVIFWLMNIKFGTSVMRMLLDTEVLGIDDIQIWPQRATPDGFTSNTVGVSMWMTMDGFCKFLEQTLNDETMCITVNGFRITNSALRAYADPPLKIDLLFTIDEYKYEPKPPSGAGGAPGSPELSTLEKMKASRPRAAPLATEKKEESFWQKLWPF